MSLFMPLLSETDNAIKVERSWVVHGGRMSDFGGR